jgi:hypothetical protein
MSAGTGTTSVQKQASCCICAQSSTEGTRDKAGRFVCAECLERARKAILDRRAREARAKHDAKLEQQVAAAEADNSDVLKWRSALDPAFALLCPNCGRFLHIDVGACHACGYGVEDQKPPKRFSLFGRARTGRAPVAPHLLDLRVPWVDSIDPRAEGVLPVALAVLLWTAVVMAFFNPAARVTAGVLVAAALALLAAWFLFATAARSAKAAAWCAIAPLCALILVFVDPLPAHPGVRWGALAVLLVITSGVVLSRARGAIVGLWVVSLVAGLAMLVREVAG